MNDYNDKAYVLAMADDSPFYIPGALHIERNDALMLVESDEEAAICAEQDGIRLIYDMDFVPDGVYIDTPENREILLRGLTQYPQYKDVVAAGHVADPDETTSGFQMKLGKG